MTPPRTTGRRLCETIHLAAAGIWLGALLMSGAVAGVVFTKTPELDPTLGRFAAYPGDHARLAAGYVQNEVFKLTDLTQFVASLICLATMIGLIALYRLPIRSLVGAVRLVSLMLGLSALSYYILVLTPRMSENLRAFYAAAEAGEVETAERFRALFDADHPTATNVFAVITIGVLVMFISGLWSATGPATEEGAVGRRPRAAKGGGSRLEEPRLAKGANR